MEREFYNVVSETRRYEILPTNLDALKNGLRRWESILKKIHVEIRDEFKNLYWSELSRIVFTLRDIKDPTIRGSHDRIFKNLLGMEKRIPSALTIIFGNFIKGITYFQNQNASGVEIPIYHRLYSCGTGDEAFRNTYQKCIPDMDKQDRIDVRTRIETCYIERLIYDDMYRHLVLFFPNIGTEEQSQDRAHLDRLALTKEDFETCFPNLRITIQIEYDSTHWPIELKIQRYIRDKLVSTEQYNRTILFSDIFSDKMYEEAVEATKTTSEYTYFRIQRFAYRPSWKRLPT
jgi:hypothetical protein